MTQKGRLGFRRNGLQGQWAGRVEKAEEAPSPWGKAQVNWQEPEDEWVEQMVQGQESSSVLCRVATKGTQTGKQSCGLSTPRRRVYEGHKPVGPHLATIGTVCLNAAPYKVGTVPSPGR